MKIQNNKEKKQNNSSSKLKNNIEEDYEIQKIKEKNI